jgi:hypothetical protein
VNSDHPSGGGGAFRYSTAAFSVNSVNVGRSQKAPATKKQAAAVDRASHWRSGALALDLRRWRPCPCKRRRGTRSASPEAAHLACDVVIDAFGHDSGLVAKFLLRRGNRTLRELVRDTVRDAVAPRVTARRASPRSRSGSRARGSATPLLPPLTRTRPASSPRVHRTRAGLETESVSTGAPGAHPAKLRGAASRRDAGLGHAVPHPRGQHPAPPAVPALFAAHARVHGRDA